MTRSPLTGPLRRIAGFTAVALLAVTLQGCGSSPKAALSPGTEGTAPDTAVAAGQPDVPQVERNAFPAWIKHKWGTTVVPEEPKRVVSLGLRDHEMMIALGVTPITVRNAFGQDHPYSDWPWVPDRINEGDYKYLQAGLQDPKTGKIAPPDPGPIDSNGVPEAAVTPHLHQVFDWKAIADLKPDLIVGTFSGITKEDYDKLVKIAPTITEVSADKRDYFSSWQENLLWLGAALGRPKAAAQLSADTEQLFETVRQEHPEFKNSTVAVVAPGGNGKVRVINPYAPMARFFTSLRMTYPAGIEGLMDGPKNIYGVEIDSGSLGLLGNVDALVWIAGSEPNEQLDKIKNSASYQSLPVVRRGGAVYLDGGLAEALYFASPLSLPWAMDKLKPVLFKALEPKAARDAAAAAAAERAARTADENGDFTFEFGTPDPTPDPADGVDGNGYVDPSATDSPSPDPTDAGDPTDPDAVDPNADGVANNDQSTSDGQPTTGPN